MPLLDIHSPVVLLEALQNAVGATGFADAPRTQIELTMEPILELNE